MHACMHTYMHRHTRVHMRTFSHMPATAFISWVSKLLLSCQHFRKEIWDQCSSPQPYSRSVPRPQDVRKLSSHVALSWSLTHGVSHCESHPHVWVSQPGPAGGDDSTVPLHASHTEALSTKDRPRSDLAKWDDSSEGHCPGHSKEQTRSVLPQVWSTDQQQHLCYLGAGWKCRHAGPIRLHYLITSGWVGGGALSFSRALGVSMST